MSFVLSQSEERCAKFPNKFQSYNRSGPGDGEVLTPHPTTHPYPYHLMTTPPLAPTTTSSLVITYLEKEKNKHPPYHPPPPLPHTTTSYLQLIPLHIQNDKHAHTTTLPPTTPLYSILQDQIAKIKRA